MNLVLNVIVENFIYRVSMSSSSLPFFFFLSQHLTFVYYFRLVDGAGGIKLTKDGKVLLSEMVK